MDEVVEVLRDAGLAAEGPVRPMDSGDSAAVKIAVASLGTGGLTAAAKALETMLARHGNKHLLVDGGGERSTLRGTPRRNWSRFFARSMRVVGIRPIHRVGSETESACRTRTS